MAQKRKLQVFISSTYTDLQEERQAAVQAILTTGHIPAGMELFAAGDKSQLMVIKNWIQESDVYLLILGGRYGSIEPESQKSYIQLEYEYALEIGKPLFAVVISDDHLDTKVRTDGLRAVETDHNEKLKEFRKLVCSRMVRFWSDPRDIKISIMETLYDLSNRADLNLVGWIPGNQGNIGTIAEELARITKQNGDLVKENASLRDQLLSVQKPSITYNGLSYEELCSLMNSFKLSPIAFQSGVGNALEDVAVAFGSTAPTLLHYFWLYSTYLSNGALRGPLSASEKAQVERLEKLRLVYDQNPNQKNKPVFSFTEAGNQFFLRLLLNSKAEAANFIFYVPK